MVTRDTLAVKVTKLARLSHTATLEHTRETAELVADSLKDVLSLMSMGYTGRSLHQALLDLAADHYRDSLVTRSCIKRRRERIQSAVFCSVAKRVERL